MKKDADIRSQVTKGRLLEASAQVFARCGYFDTSVDTITREAGLSHGTFYLHFKNKNEALVEVLQAAVSETFASLTAPGRPSAVGVEALRLPVQGLVESLDEQAGLLKAFVQGMMQDSGIFALFSRLTRTLADFLALPIPAAAPAGMAPRRKGEVVLAQIMAVTTVMSAFLRCEAIIRCTPEVLAEGLTLVFFPALCGPSRLPASSRRRAPGTRPDRMRERLVNAARTEFSEQGYFETTVALIVKRAGCSRGTFYKYFPDKDAVLESLFQEMFRDINPPPSLGEGLISGIDPTREQDLARVITLVLDMFAVNTPLNWSLLQGVFFSRQLNQNYRHWFEHFSEPVAAKVACQQARGRCTGVDPQVASQIILTMVSYAAFMFSAEVIACPRERFAAALTRILFHFLNSRQPSLAPPACGN